MEHGHIPGTVVEIRYNRNGTHYRHAFKPGVKQRIHANGAVTLYHPTRPVWADDREPGFWDRYGDRHPRNPSSRGGTMARRGGTNWLMWGLLAGAAYLLFAPRGGFAGSAQPVNYWIAPTGDLSTLTLAPGITPPQPGYRPASEYELRSMAPM